MTLVDLPPTQAVATTAIDEGVFVRAARHEQVVFCSEPRSGLSAIIAVHSTRLGPSLGGTRFYPYGRESDALADVLRLSEAMSYKSAVAGLDLGGGKAVVIGDPATGKSEALLRAYGQFVSSLGGRYITACDVGTYAEDMDVVGRETPHVVGRSVAMGGSGDSAVLTAVGVLHGMRAAVEHAYGSPELAGRTVAIEGAGKVGRRLAGHLLDEGARVVVFDIDDAALRRLRAEHPRVVLAADRDELWPADVYSPCALGATVTAELAARLSARVICGAANNQLADPDVELLLGERGIVYAPDFVVNAGGLIQVADERDGYRPERARARAAGIFDVTRRILETADRERVTAGTAARAAAEERMRAVGALRGFQL